MVSNITLLHLADCYLGEILAPSLKDGHNLLFGRETYSAMEIIVGIFHETGNPNTLYTLDHLMFSDFLKPHILRLYLGDYPITGGAIFGTFANLMLMSGLAEVVADKRIGLSKWYKEHLIKNGRPDNLVKFMHENVPVRRKSEQRALLPDIEVLMAVYRILTHTAHAGDFPKDLMVCIRPMQVFEISPLSVDKIKAEVLKWTERIGDLLRNVTDGDYTLAVGEVMYPMFLIPKHKGEQGQTVFSQLATLAITEVGTPDGDFLALTPDGRRLLNVIN